VDWPELILELAEEGQPDWVALEHDERTVTIKELAARMSAAAGRLRDGSGPVAVSHPDPLVHTVAVLGAVAAGRTAMLVDVKFPDDLLRQVAAIAGVRTTVGRSLEGIELATDEELAAASPTAPVPTPPESTGSIFLTSGTTGLPKLVMRSRGADLHAAMCLRLANFPIDPGDRHWLCVPYASAAFLTLAMGAIFARATLVFGPFDRRGVGAFLAERSISGAYLVPTMLRLAGEHDDFRGPGWAGLRGLMIGGEKLDGPTAEILLDAFPGRVYLGYGMTEIPRPTEATFEQLTERPGTVGKPIPFRRVRIVEPGSDRPLPTGEEGEVLVTGPDLFQGYLGMDPTPAWHRTGDLGRVDEDGFLYLTGRATSVVKIGGNRVSTDEVAAELRRNPDVAQAAVIAVDDPVWTTRLEAFVVAGPGAAPTAEMLEAWLRGRQPGYKVPRAFHLLDELPSDSSGKLSLEALKALARTR
jgi:acyl-CoA synthetase (AMP-forming)/AMP-acid ligase II